jgi:hypothetical protein
VEQVAGQFGFELSKGLGCGTIDGKAGEIEGAVMAVANQIIL